MSSLKSLFLLGFVGLVAVSHQAKADVFVWQNQDKDVSVVFPDRWGIVNNHQYDEILRIAAPSIKGQHEEAQCRIRVRDDHRFSMHPISHSDEIQRVHFSDDFWSEYVSEFAGARIHQVTNNAGLGRGFASFADITFESQEHPKMIRRGIAFASLYQSQLHIFECSAEQSAYDKWHYSFLGILKSIDFKSKEPLKRGFYRDFYKGKTTIEGRTPLDFYTF